MGRGKKKEDSTIFDSTTADVLGASSVTRPLFKDCKENHLIDDNSTEEFDFKIIKNTPLRSKARKLLSLIDDDDSYEFSAKIHECIDIILRDDAILSAQKNLRKKD